MREFTRERYSVSEQVKKNTGILAVTHLNTSDLSLHQQINKAQQNRVWLVIIHNAVKKLLYLAQSQPANADLNLAADDRTRWAI